MWPASYRLATGLVKGILETGRDSAVTDTPEVPGHHLQVAGETTQTMSRLAMRW